MRLIAKKLIELNFNGSAGLTQECCKKIDLTDRLAIITGKCLHAARDESGAFGRKTYGLSRKTRAERGSTVVRKTLKLQWLDHVASVA